jgi:hypothetical protein
MDIQERTVYTKYGYLVPKHSKIPRKQFHELFLEYVKHPEHKAMLMKKVVFLSDREFFKAPCRDHALYFDPLSVANAEEVISKWYFETHQANQLEHIEAAHQFITSKKWSIAKAKSYMNIILK